MPRQTRDLSVILYVLGVLAMPARLVHVVLGEPGSKNPFVFSLIVLTGSWAWAKLLVAIGMGGWVTYFLVASTTFMLLWVRIMYPNRKLQY